MEHGQKTAQAAVSNCQLIFLSFRIVFLGFNSKEEIFSLAVKRDLEALGCLQILFFCDRVN